MVDAVWFFFETGHISPSFNSNFIVLFPKTPEVDFVDQFRPIAIGNVLFEIITKLIGDRLPKVVSWIISTNQFGFNKGQNIQDCIITALGCVNLFNKKRFRVNLAMKLDIQKVFDSIRWIFILKVLSKFGFFESLCNWIIWILLILKSVRTSLLISGKPDEYFCCSRGFFRGILCFFFLV